jgi:hypothetical protein
MQTSTTYYPEMGGKADTAALFQSFHVIGRFMALRWSPEHDTAARAAFKSLKVRPSRVELTPAEHRRDGRAMWGALCTWEASRKLYDAGLVTREMLLD